MINVFLMQGLIDGANDRIQFSSTVCISFAFTPSTAMETTNDWSSNWPSIALLMGLMLGISGALSWITAPNLTKSQGTSNCTSFKKLAYIWAVFWETKLPLSRFSKYFLNFSFKDEGRLLFYFTIQINQSTVQQWIKLLSYLFCEILLIPISN